MTEHYHGIFLLFPVFKVFTRFLFESLYAITCDIFSFHFLRLL